MSMKLASSRSVVPIAITFDALNTLIEITGGVGCQYRRVFSEFLSSHVGMNMDTDLPNASEAVVEKVALKTIWDEVRADREVWHRSNPTHSPKEMPIGGLDDAALRLFWRRVLSKVFTHPEVLSGASPGNAERAMQLIQEPAWEVFEDHMIFNEFGSTKTHSWLPEGKRTVEKIQAWRQAQRITAETTTEFDTGLLESMPSSLLYMKQPPSIVTNMDPRLRGIMGELGALDGLFPLIHEVVTARDVGFAKPSAAGLRRCAIAAGISDMRFLIHVGDAEADRVACERLGCQYVQCNASTGVVWEDLEGAIKKLEGYL